MTKYLGVSQNSKVGPNATPRDILYNGEFGICILDDQERSAVAERFEVQAASAQPAGFDSQGRHPADLQKVIDFILSNVDDPIGVRVVFEISSLRYPKDAPLLALLIALNQLGCCCCSFPGADSTDPRAAVSIALLPPPLRQKIEADILNRMTQEAADQVERRGGMVLGPDPLFLGTGVGRAYADFLLSKPASLVQAAAAAALAAVRPCIHAYLFSSGLVQSAQDVVVSIEQYCDYKGTDRKADMHSVFSGSEIYTQRFTDETIIENLDKIPLAHAVTMQKYGHLGEREALKFALLAVSRKWKTELYCKNDNLENSLPPPAINDQDAFCVRPEYLIYSPKSDPDDWFLPLLESLGVTQSTLPAYSLSVPTAAEPPAAQAAQAKRSESTVLGRLRRLFRT